MLDGTATGKLLHNYWCGGYEATSSWNQIFQATHTGADLGLKAILFAWRASNVSLADGCVVLPVQGVSMLSKLSLFP